MKITQTKIFEKAHSELPREAKGAVVEAVEKLKKTPEGKGLELKPMYACDSSIREVRVTKACRLICQKKEDRWVLLYVDTDHDKALRWAENNCRPAKELSFVETEDGVLSVLFQEPEVFCVEGQMGAKLADIVNRANIRSEKLVQDYSAAMALAEEAESKASHSREAELKANHQKEILEAENARLKEEVALALANRSRLDIAAPDLLVAVNERVVYRGSSCTEIVMKSGSKRYMKTQTFDADGATTRKAKNLVGALVCITCWDPIGAPGKWSKQGYFRNIYAVKEAA